MKYVLPLCLLVVPTVAFGGAGMHVYNNIYSYDSDTFATRNNTIRQYGTLPVNNKTNKTNRLNNYNYYAGLHAGVSFLTWENKYTNESGTKLGADDFNLKPIVGLDVFGGYYFNDDWRADLEIGYVGKYNEGETEYYENYITEKTNFDLETYYVMANGYYNMRYGLYLGAGLGVAFTDVSLNHTQLKKAEETNASLIGNLMFGWLYKLDDRVDLDLRYRFALFDGGDLKTNTGAGTYIKTDVGTVVDNVLSVGVHYKF